MGHLWLIMWVEHLWLNGQRIYHLMGGHLSQSEFHLEKNAGLPWFMFLLTPDGLST